MTESVQLALVVAASTLVSAITVSVIAPMVMSRNVNKSRAEEKRLDWAREDKVAADAAEAARKLLESNNRIAAATDESTKTLKVVHTLVNSGLTSSKQATLDANKFSLGLLKDRQPSVENTAAVKAMEAKIAELEAELSERAKQQKEADAQAAKVASSGGGGIEGAAHGVALAVKGVAEAVVVEVKKAGDASAAVQVQIGETPPRPGG